MSFETLPFEILPIIFLGLVLGSFATALSYRLPRGISIIRVVRSKCPQCHATLTWKDLIPLFSWLFLKGRCRRCHAKIGLRYPLIELATLLICLLLYNVYGLEPRQLPVYLLAPIIVSLIDIDFQYKIIPDALNLALGALGIILAPMSDFATVAGGIAIYGLGSLALRAVAMKIMKREPMGLGDVKFFAAAGVWLGLSLERAATIMIVAGLSGIILSLIWKKRTGEAEVPFGPSLVIGFMAAIYLYPPWL